MSGSRVQVQTHTCAKYATYRDADVGNDAVTEREAGDVLAHLDDLPDRFMARNELAGLTSETQIVRDHGDRHTGNVAINSPSWMWPSVPQTPQQVTDQCLSMTHISGRHGGVAHL